MTPSRSARSASKDGAAPKPRAGRPRLGLDGRALHYTSPSVGRVGEIALGNAPECRIGVYRRLILAWLGSHAHYVRWKMLGKGSYGVVYRFDSFVSGMKKHLAAYATENWRHVRGAVDDIPGADVALKISARPDEPEFVRSFYASVLRELRVHAALTVAQPTVVDGVVFDIREFVPKLYFAGYDARKQALGVFMERVAGVPLFNIDLENQAIRREVRPLFVRAVLSLWLAGYFHMDLHNGNVLVDLSGDAPALKIIDFGLAVEMPAAYVDDLRAYIDRLGQLAAVHRFWETHGEAFADTVVHKREATLFDAGEYWSNITPLRAIDGRL